MRCPALPIALAFAGAICVASAASPLAAPTPVLFGGVAAVLLALSGAHAASGYRRPAAASFAVVVAFGCLGKAAYDLRRLEAERPVRGLRHLFETLGERAFVAPAHISASLRAEPSFGLETASLLLEVEAIGLRGKRFPSAGAVAATVRGAYLEKLEPLRAGDRVALWGRLRSPRTFGNPGSFDAASHLERGDIDLYLSVKSALLVEVLSQAPRFGWRTMLSGMRARARHRLDAALGSDRESRGIMLALVTGDRSELAPELESAFQRAGIFHVMAISGAHVAVVALCVVGLLRRIGLDEGPALALLFLLLPLYAGVTGARPPVTRAVVMIAMVIGARWLSLDRPRLNALALGALVLLLWKPQSLSDPGFQLSFAAMASIVVFAEPLAHSMKRCGLRFLAVPLAVSMAAQLGTLPFAAWHFHRLTPWSPIASLVAMPVASAILVVGSLMALTPSLAGLTVGCAALGRALCHWLIVVAQATLQLPGASVAVPRSAAIVTLLVLTVLLIVVAQTIAPRVKVALVAGLTLAAWARLAPPAFPEGLTVTAIDVGHGDAVLMRLPEGQHLLIDGGGAPGSSFDIGERVVVPFLLDRGVRKLDAVVLSHADYDHLGGLFAVVETLRVERVWEGAPRHDRAVYRAFRRRAHEHGIGFRRLAASETFDLGGARFEILAAGAPSESENDRSLVMRVSYAGRRLLLTGDAERGLEAELLRRGTDLSADILKLGHHGSASSSTAAFLAAVDPSLAVISARARPGPGWPIPSARVLNRLKAMGIEYLRTDTEGAITVTITPTGEMNVTTHRAQE